jgi:hypothetical protein
LIFSTAPVWGMLLGSVLGHERPTGRGVVGVALSIVGVEVVFYEGLGAGSTSLIGNLWVLLAAVSVGVYTVLSVPLLERHTPLTVATYPILFGGPFVLLLSSPQLLNLGWGSVGVGVWAAVGDAAEVGGSPLGRRERADVLESGVRSDDRPREHPVHGAVGGRGAGDKRGVDSLNSLEPPLWCPGGGSSGGPAEGALTSA